MHKFVKYAYPIVSDRMNTFKMADCLSQFSKFYHVNHEKRAYYVAQRRVVKILSIYFQSLAWL